ncbi:MAG: phosphatase [Tyzzerella sp.]|nr:phosphatase [Tyzzerella sp.]
MKKVIADLHTHTLASGHAYSTIQEMAQRASEMGIKLLGITEHGPMVPSSCQPIYFHNYKVINRYYNGVRLLMGAEVNILDYDGNLDLTSGDMRWFDICIAGIHNNVCYSAGSVMENTRAYCKVMENPDVDIISHPDDGRVPVDYEQLVRNSKETNVLLELNNSSLNPFNVRAKGNSAENMRTMMKYCEKYDVPLIINSDAHYSMEVGDFSRVQSLIEEVHFPQELIVNYSVENVLKYLHRFDSEKLLKELKEKEVI